ncbi:hypothetical protein FB451DRAFT_1257358 [Mycena latifolia]|nr:hypothetical protein FB451DRAFT_1257358 [Mycena latifolia]
MSGIRDSNRPIHHATQVAPFPPLQAALGLVAYINESIALFKSNGKAIKDIGGFSRRLSQVLLDRSINPTSTTKFTQVIENIHTYVQEVSTMTTIIQYFMHKHNTDKLQGFHKNLWDEFSALRVESDIKVQTFQKAAELARKEDADETQKAFQKLSSDIKSDGAGVRNLADGLGLSRSAAYIQEVLRELQTIPGDDLEDEAEVTVLKEGIRLTTALLSSNYKWFRETFNAQEFSLSQVKNGLAEGISGVIPDLQYSGLLAAKTIRELSSTVSPLEQINILFRMLDGRPRDAILIRTFQRAVSRHCQVPHLMKEGLDL